MFLNVDDLIPSHELSALLSLAPPASLVDLVLLTYQSSFEFRSLLLLLDGP